MRNLLNKLGAAAFGLLALAVVTVAPIQSASANDFCPAKYSDPRYIRYDCASITSPTTPAAVGVIDVNPRRDTTIALKGVGVTASVTILYYSGDTVVDQQSVAVTNGQLTRVTLTAPLWFDGISISPTTSLGNNSINADVISARK